MKRAAGVNPDEGTPSKPRHGREDGDAAAKDGHEELVQGAVASGEGSTGDHSMADDSDGDREAGDRDDEGGADAERKSDAPEAPDEELEKKLPAPSADERAEDKRLVALAQAGDHAAFRSLFERYHRRAFAVAYGVVKNKEDASDVVQEAFVKVHKHLGNFQGTSSFYTWLYRIVMNLAIDHLRRKKTARPIEYDDGIARTPEAGDEAIMPRMMGTNPRRAVLRREVLERVEKALETLPEYHREVILLREVEGLSYEEMAEALEVPKGTIMSRLFHARRKMQAALAEYVGGDLDLEE